MISRRFSYRPIFAVLAILVLALPSRLANASTVSVMECDALTADEDDPNRVSGAVDDEKLDLDTALEVCERAFEDDPENPRIQFQLAKVLYFQEKTEKAIGLLEKSSDKGYAASYYLLAHIYRHGIDVKADFSKALKFYLRAAENGLAASYVFAGMMYENGVGVSKDPTRAIDLYLKAAAAGNRDGFFAAGAVFYSGKGVPRDPEKAASFFLRA